MKSWIPGGTLLAFMVAGVFGGGARSVSASKGFEKNTTYKCLDCHKTKEGKRDDLTDGCGKESDKWLKALKEPFDYKKGLAAQKQGVKDDKNPEYRKIREFVCSTKK